MNRSIFPCRNIQVYDSDCVYILWCLIMIKCYFPILKRWIRKWLWVFISLLHNYLTAVSLSLILMKESIWRIYLCKYLDQQFMIENQFIIIPLSWINTKTIYIHDDFDNIPLQSCFDWLIVFTMWKQPYSKGKCQFIKMSSEMHANKLEQSTPIWFA